MQFFPDLWHDALTDSLLMRKLFLKSNRWCKFHEDLWPNALTDSLFVREGKNRVGCEVINSSKADYRVENISFCQKASFELNYAIILLCPFWECWPKQYIKTHRKKNVRQLYHIEYNNNKKIYIYTYTGCQTWWQSGCSLPCTRSELQRGEAKGIPSGIYVLMDQSWI